MANYEGVKCPMNHRLEIISEGYGICTDDSDRPWRLGAEPACHAWAFGIPALLERDGLKSRWAGYWMFGRNDKEIRAWCTEPAETREWCLDYIQKDIDAHRALPFDEERERSRLMPV